MAKRVKDNEPYHPVRASLVADVLAGGGGASTAREAEPAVAPSPRPAPVVLPQPAPAPARFEPRPRVQAAPPPEPEAVPTFDPRQRLSREKRYLLSPDEEDRIEDLVRSMARELQTPLKLSHLVRATISLLNRAQQELLAQARSKETFARPSNGDTPGLLRFEAEVAKLLDAAFRMTKPMQ